MTKDSRSRSKKKHQANSTLELNTTPKKSRRVPLWQALLLPVTAVAIFFLLLEGGLPLFAPKSALQEANFFAGVAFKCSIVRSFPRAGRQADYGHSRQIPNYDPVHDLLGIIMAKRNRPRIVYRV